jgi:sterol desaturase/sphingolipid hydroxylase (fatty acid hydroxylase superfamily)
VVHAPLILVAPVFYATLVFCTLEYYVKHKRSHLDVEWAREHLPWHYDHHMGPNQDANWCVTRPWFDHVMGTRIPYAGTEREATDVARAAARAARRSATPPPSPRIPTLAVAGS